MSDQALKNAEARRKSLATRRIALHQEISLLDTEIGEIDSFIKAWHTFAGDSTHDELPPDSETKVEQNESYTQKTRGNSSKEEVAEAAESLIREAGRPLERRELFDALIQHGLKIDGKDPLAVLSTMMWRMKDRIAKFPDGRYGLVEPQASDFQDVLG